MGLTTIGTLGASHLLARLRRSRANQGLGDPLQSRSELVLWFGLAASSAPLLLVAPELEEPGSYGTRDDLGDALAWGSAGAGQFLAVSALLLSAINLGRGVAASLATSVVHPLWKASAFSFDMAMFMTLRAGGSLLAGVLEPVEVFFVIVGATVCFLVSALAAWPVALRPKAKAGE